MEQEVDPGGSRKQLRNQLAGHHGRGPRSATIALWLLHEGSLGWWWTAGRDNGYGRKRRNGREGGNCQVPGGGMDATNLALPFLPSRVP